MENDFSRILECPRCLEYMVSSIYVCVSGHSLCENCWSTSTKCSLCLKSISETRNYSLEAVADYVEFPCDYAQFGCDKKLKKAHIQHHLKVCRFSQHKCMLGDCNWQGTLDQLVEHAIESHVEQYLQPENPKQYTILTYCTNQPQHFVYLYARKSEIFCIHRKINNGLMYWVVQDLQPDLEKTSYSFEIIFEDSKEQRKIKYVENCVDFSTDLDFSWKKTYAVIPIAVMKEQILDSVGDKFYGSADFKFVIRS